MITEKQIVRKTLKELLPDIKDLEKSIELEFTNICNAVCTMCPRTEQHRAKGYMTIETLEIILDKAASYGVNNISIGGFGEPLLHKQFCTMIQMIREKLPEAKISITTNGLLLTKTIVEELFTIGMPEFSVSFHNDNREDYERTMKISHTRVMENLHTLLKELPESARFIHVGIVKTKENVHQIDNIISCWSELGVTQFTLLIGHNRAGQLNDKRLLDDEFYVSEQVEVKQAHNLLCKKASVVLKFVDWEGLVRLCCNDLKGKTLLTDLRTGSFEDAEQNRAKVWTDSQSDFCKKCNMPSTLLEAQIIAIV